MSKLFAGMGMSTGVAATAAAAAVTIGAVAWTQFGGTSTPIEPEKTALVQPETTPSADTPKSNEVAKPQDQPQAEVAETDPQAPTPAPAFDEVRREEDGMTVIAGRAVPGAAVVILKDGQEVSRTKADGAGKFAALMMIAPDGAGHVLSLLQQIDGEEIASEGQIILAPLSPPVALAEADAPDERPQETVETDPEPLPEASEPAVTAQAAPTEPAAPETTEQEIVVAQAAQPSPEVPTQEQQEPAPTEPEATNEAKAQPAPADEPVTPEVAEATPAPETQEPTKTAEIAQAEPNEDQPKNDTEAEPEAPVSPAVALLQTTADGVELLNAKSPEVMDNVALDTISYSDQGDVQLAGRAQTNATSVRVYLDNDAVVNLPVDDRGRWRGDLPNVDEGIYTLRVDEVATDGAVISRVETPFKREAPEVLAAASAQSDGPIKAITVQKGATLWAIAQNRYGSGALYVRVFEANRETIRDPDLIYPGQIFDLPEDEG